MGKKIRSTLVWKPLTDLHINRMFFNSVQNFQPWLDTFNNPHGSELGLLSALYQIGSLVSIPLVCVYIDLGSDRDTKALE